MSIACSQPGGEEGARRGATLVEMLVGSSILAVIFALIAGSVSYVRGVGDRAQRANWLEQRHLDPTIGVLPGRPVNILFIGNSLTFTWNLPGIVQALAQASGPNVQLNYQMWAQSGWSLSNHWSDGTALQLIQSQQWDFVVLQEQATLPNDDPETFFKYARLFNTAIQSHQAITVFYQTMAHQALLSTQAKINQSYFKIAKELNAEVMPVGVAFTQAAKQVSYQNLYSPDQIHPTQNGSYLAGCVFYAGLYGNTPVGLPGRLADANGVAFMEIDPSMAAILQPAALKATKDSRPLWAPSWRGSSSKGQGS
jgi:hypothetical protein